MRSKLAIGLIILLIFASTRWAKQRLAEPPAPTSDARRAERIVSLAPSVTETLFALGLGDRVVGVTEYCYYPPDARNKTKVGGYLNPNYEAIVRLEPDLVVLLEAEASSPLAFDKLGLPTLYVNHKRLDGIIESMLALGRACGAEDKAEATVADIRSQLETIRQKTAGRPRPRVMIVVERDLAAGKLEDVCIAGQDGHLDRMIELAGGQNAYHHGAVRFPKVSHEGILDMDPQVIVDLVPHRTAVGRQPQELVEDWSQLAGVEAVQRGRVNIVQDDYVFIPGPRFIMTVEKFARLIHPEVDWEE